MRSVQDTYRNHFPALILGRVRDAASLRWHYAWTELTPGERDNYSIQPGARTGTADLHYALEENDRQVEAGAVVWMRHRDEDGGAVHYAFTHLSARLGAVAPDPTVPPSGGSGSLQGALCLTVTDEGGCSCLAGDYVLEYAPPLGAWIASAEVCSLGYEWLYRRKADDSGYELGLLVAGSVVGDSWYDADPLPFELHGIDVSGSACAGEIAVRLSAGPCGGCDQTIGGAGTLCFGPDLVLHFQNVTPFGAVSSVCPVWGTIEPGDGIAIDRLGPLSFRIRANGGAAEGGPIDFVAGLVVQRQTLQLPAGLVVEAAECREDPSDCCASGGSEGCCFPRPPDVLWAWRLGASAGCACVESCVELIYDATRDAWYGGPMGDACAVTADVLLRLKCIMGVYHLDCVLRGATPADADLVGLSGSPSSVATPSCDPFLYAWDFADAGPAGPAVCSGSGTFSYLLTEAPCTPGSGSGGGGAGTIETDCCTPDLLPESLYATFTGALSGIGTLHLTFVGGGLGSTWRAFTAACGGMTIDFLCLGTSRHWGLTSLGSTVIDLDAEAAAASCVPFLWSATGTAAGTCSGAFGVTITDSPP